MERKGNISDSFLCSKLAIATQLMIPQAILVFAFAFRTYIGSLDLDRNDSLPRTLRLLLLLEGVHRGPPARVGLVPRSHVLEEGRLRRHRPQVKVHVGGGVEHRVGEAGREGHCNNKQSGCIGVFLNGNQTTHS